MILYKEDEDVIDYTRTIVILLFGLSLTQECICQYECGDSIAAFLFGWIGALMEFGDIVTGKFFGANVGKTAYFLKGATFAWLANPLSVLAILLIRKKPKNALIFSIIATILAISFLFFKGTMSDEGGGYSEITGYKAGFWLWLLSIITLLAGSFIIFKRQKEDSQI